MPPEGRFTTPTTPSTVFSDDFNDKIITNATCVREALIEVDLISASSSRFAKEGDGPDVESGPFGAPRRRDRRYAARDARSTI